MYKTKNINKYLFLLFLLSSFITSFTSLAEENLHSGDYIINPKTGKPEPFFPDLNRNLSDHVQGCENNPGIEKNVSRLGFIPTAIIGEDDRCPLDYGPNAPEIDKAFYGVGLLYDNREDCKKNLIPCYSGTGHLVLRRDTIITNAHLFYDETNKQIIDWKNFVFRIKVWIPEKRRKDKNIPYEFKVYSVQNVIMGTKDPMDNLGKDYAFVKLNMPVSEVVDQIPIDKKYWIKPLQFKKIDRNKLQNIGMMVGFPGDKGNVAHKNCQPFKLLTPGSNPYWDKYGDIVFHDGDAVAGSSGSAIALLDENGVPTLAAIHRGDETQDEKLKNSAESSGPKNSTINGKNLAIDANSIFDKYQEFLKNNP